VAIAPRCRRDACPPYWGDDERFVRTYFGTFKSKMVYSTFDWGIRDKDGYYFILGRTDDVISTSRDIGWAPARSRSGAGTSEHRGSRGGGL